MAAVNGDAAVTFELQVNNSQGRLIDVVTGSPGVFSAELLAGGDIDRARDALRRLTGPIRLMEAPEGTHLVATYDLGIDQLITPRRSKPRLEHVARLSELVVAGAGFEPATFGL